MFQPDRAIFREFCTVKSNLKTNAYPTHNKISRWTDTEQADDNHNKQQDQASPQWLWYNILTFLRDDIDHNIL
jgi:hypothetical protein